MIKYNQYTLIVNFVFSPKNINFQSKQDYFNARTIKSMNHLLNLYPSNPGRGGGAYVPLLAFFGVEELSV